MSELILAPPPGTFFYGIVPDDYDEVLYVGDRIVCMMINPSSEGLPQYIVIQSLFSQAHAYIYEDAVGAIGHAIPDDFALFNPEFHSLIEQYLLNPSDKNSKLLVSYKPTEVYTLRRRDNMTHFKTFKPTAEEFLEVLRHQQELIDANRYCYDDYIHEYLESENQFVMKDEFFRTYTPEAFERLFNIRNRFNHIIYNTNPL